MMPVLMALPNHGPRLSEPHCHDPTISMISGGPRGCGDSPLHLNQLRAGAVFFAVSGICFAQGVGQALYMAANTTLISRRFTGAVMHVVIETHVSTSLHSQDPFFRILFCNSIFCPRDVASGLFLFLLKGPWRSQG